MPKGYPSLTPEQKADIVNRVREKGERVPDLAREYGVWPKSIYNALGKMAGTPNTAVEVARLKRENEALIAIIGRMTAEQKIGKKRRYGSAG